MLHAASCALLLAHSSLASRTVGGIFRDLATGSLRFFLLETDEASVAAVSRNSSGSEVLSAWGSFNDTIAKTGWSTLEITSNASEPNEVQATAAGQLEGHLTHGRIEEYLHNMVGASTDFSAELSSFLQANLDYTLRKAEAGARDGDDYWQTVGLAIAQLQGMYAGYAEARQQRGSAAAAPFDVFYAATLDGDLDDLCVAFGPSSCGGQVGARRRNSSHGHCSVLVKVLGDDVLMGHTTWSSFESMTRIYKTITLQFTGIASLQSRTVAFPSYPASITSIDDWYQMSNGLVVTETTNANNNASLWRYVVPEIVLYWARNAAANRLAKDGLQWAELFLRENSGTYNNQWMIFDTNKFRPAQAAEGEAKAEAGMFVVLEQMPGRFTETQDMTSYLLNKGHWVSYNRPFFPSIFNASNQSALVASLGEHYSWGNTARAQLFAQLQSSAVDEDSLYKVMRHNNFMQDKVGVQGCEEGRSASNAIAERGDLTLASSQCISDIGPIDEASTDVKLTSFKRMWPQHRKQQQRAVLSSVAQAGPPCSSEEGAGGRAGEMTVPVFQWSKAPPRISNLPHAGQPDLWNFPLLTFTARFSTA